nr:uncharacterized protein CFP56_42052 [Quercus suber]
MSTLTSAQSYALYDILTHSETYAEIEAFKSPETIKTYGVPFQDNLKSSSSPVLQTLLSKFALELPGLKDVTPTFWTTQVEDLIQDLAAAELSESYDKGLLGIRKTLATAISALLEYPARAVLDGVEKVELKEKPEYDVKDPDDVLAAWQDCLQEMVYGNLFDRLFEKAAETDDLGQHETLVQAMHEFVVVNVASLMHYTLVLSPEGPTLLRMMENVHSLLPYAIVRQTLKIGNVASMIGAMMRVILAKVSVASVTNWIGLSSGADEGMNLMQQIISQVLGWDKREFKKRSDKIEKDKDAPPKAVLAELRDWITRSREEHLECRRQSRDGNMSIVAVILSLSSLSTELSAAQHSMALQYLSLNLAIRDRQEIVRVMCRRNPDHLTTAVRDAVDAYTPMIREVHKAVNLSDTVWDFERFTTDMLKMSKPSGAKGQEQPPSVEDYVDLLHRHQASSHKFLHQVAKNGKEVTGWWKSYLLKAAAQFKRESDSSKLGRALEDLFTKLPEQNRKDVVQELNAYSEYLEELHQASAARIGAVIKRTQKTPYGPGAYLARWQQLLDQTVITPATEEGQVRYGASIGVKEEARKEPDGSVAKAGLEDQEKMKLAEMPNMDITLGLFREEFRKLLRVQG